MTQKDISIDIETLGTQAGAIVLSIGAVKFNRFGPINTDSLGEEFYAVLEVESQLERGRTRDDGTVAWWMKQSVEARAAAFDNPHRESTEEVLSRLYDFIADDFSFDCRIWGNGSDFDNTIVRSLFESYGYTELPWQFWNNRCFRTMKSEFKTIAPAPKFEGVPHHALHDAKHQARHLQQIMAKIKRNIAL